MAAISVLTFPSIFALPRTCCESVRHHADTHVPIARVPVVSARWTMETNGDGTRRLVERWSFNRHDHNFTGDFRIARQQRPKLRLEQARPALVERPIES